MALLPLLVGCVASKSKVKWEADGSPRWKTVVLKDLARTKEERIYQLQLTKEERARSIALKAKVTGRLERSTWFGRRQVQFRLHRKYVKQSPVGLQVATSVLGGVLGAGMGVVADTSWGSSSEDPDENSTFPVITITLGVIGTFIGWSAGGGKGPWTKTEQFKQRVIHESDASFDLDERPDELEQDGLAVGGVPVRFDCEGLALRAAGGQQARDSLLVTTSAGGTAWAWVTGFPVGWGKSRESAARMALDHIAGGEVKGTAERYILKELGRSATPRTYKVTASTKARASRSKANESTRNATRSAQIRGFSAKPEVVTGAALDLVHREINERVRPIRFRLRDVDTRVVIDDAIVDMTVRSPTPKQLLSERFSGKFLASILPHVTQYDSGHWQVRNSTGRFEKNLYTPSAKISLEIVHHLYHTFRRDFEAKDGALQLTIFLSKKTHPDRSRMVEEEEPQKARVK